LSYLQVYFPFILYLLFPCLAYILWATCYPNCNE